MPAPAGLQRNEILGFKISRVHLFFFLVSNSYQLVVLMWEALLSLCYSPKEGGEGRIKTRFMDLLTVSPHRSYIFSSADCTANF